MNRLLNTPPHTRWSTSSLSWALLTLTLSALSLAPHTLSARPKAPKALTIDLERAQGKAEGTAGEASGYERPFVWRLSCPARAPLHLVGTMHVPDDRFKRLPKVLLEAISESDAVYGELDLRDKERMSAAIMPHLMLPSGQQLKERLPAKTYELLERYLQRKGSSVVMFSSMKPAAVEIMLPMLELMPLMAQGLPGLDELILKRAQELGKEVGGVETIDEQLKAMFSNSDKEVVESLTHTLKRLNELLNQGKSAHDDLFQAFFSGDEKQIEATIADELKDAPPSQVKTMRRLLNKRNEVMAERILRYTKDHPKRRYLFAFGVAHFIGKESVTNALVSAGCKATRLLSTAH